MFHTYPNIEKSLYRPGEYLGYGPLGVYAVRKVSRRLWRADLIEAKPGVAHHGVQGGTLRFISERIAAGGKD